MLVVLESKSSRVHLDTVRVPNNILIMGEQDPRLNGVVKSRLGQQQSITIDDNLIGFLTPRRDNNGYWRTGAIFIIPEYRNRGYGTLAIKEFFKDKEKGIAMIEKDNIPSQKAFAKSRFKKTKEFTDKSDGTVYDIWIINNI